MVLIVFEATRLHMTQATIQKSKKHSNGPKMERARAAARKQ
jgi:hypothetical protein